MLAMPIHKDLTKYEPKIALGLSGRMVAFSALAIATVIGLGAFFWFVLGIPYDVVMFPCMLASVPAWALGFWKPSGMRLESWVPYLARHMSPSARLVYDNGERHAALRMAAGGEEEYGKAQVSVVWSKLRGQRAIERWSPGAD